MTRFLGIVLVVCALGCDSSNTPPFTGDGGSIPRSEAGQPLYDGNVGIWDGLIRGDGEICAAVKVDLSQLQPTIVLLVDQSGSMNQSFGSTLRWDAVYDTLMDGQTGVVKRLESQVRFGLALYTSENGFENGHQCPLLTEVPAALNNHQAIDDVYAPATWKDDTPTGEAVDAVAAKLKADTWPGTKAIVLATDGEPDTCDAPDPNTGDNLITARQLSVDAVTRAHDAGILVYVISVGADISDAHLTDLAKAGGGAQATPFRALAPDQLVQAFDTIVGGLIDCRFTLNGQIDPRLAGQGTVTLDGEELLHGDEWTLTDAKTLELLGAPCQALLAGGDHKVDAVFPCGAVIE